MKIRDETGKLALLLNCRKDVAENLCAEYGSVAKVIMEDSRVLMKRKGVGKAVARRHNALKTLCTMAYEAEEENVKNVIITPEEVYKMMRMKVAYIDQEEVWVIGLSAANVVTSIKMINRGTRCSCNFSPLEIMKEAILSNAVKMVLVHNHPSGNLVPSDSDIFSTNAVVDAGEVVGVRVIDHVIISGSKYRSMREEDSGYVKFFD